MNYIIFKADGSVQTKHLGSQYIQQGNDQVDQIFITYPGAVNTDYVQAVFTLPNHATNTELGSFQTHYHYDENDDDAYADGWIITLTEDQTIYNGILCVAVRVIRSNSILVNYPFTLVINETGVRPDTDTGVTVEQLDSYLLNIQTLNVETIKAYTDSALSDTSEFPVQNKVVTQAIHDSIAGVYKVMGSATVQELDDPEVSQEMNGYIYNLTDSGSIQNEDGSQTSVQEGDNVVFVWNNGNWYWDNMVGTFDTSGLVSKSGTNELSGTYTFTNGLNTPKIKNGGTHQWALIVPDTTSWSGNKSMVTSDIYNSIADEYRYDTTYDVGDLVMYNGALWQCTTAITTPESWDSTHWTLTNVSEQLANAGGGKLYTHFMKIYDSSDYMNYTFYFVSSKPQMTYGEFNEMLKASFSSTKPLIAQAYGSSFQSSNIYITHFMLYGAGTTANPVVKIAKSAPYAGYSDSYHNTTNTSANPFEDSVAEM